MRQSRDDHRSATAVQRAAAPRLDLLRRHRQNVLAQKARLDECLDLIGYEIGIYEDILDDAAATSRGGAASADPGAGPDGPAGGHPAAATGG